MATEKITGDVPELQALADDLSDAFCDLATIGMALEGIDAMRHDHSAARPDSPHAEFHRKMSSGFHALVELAAKAAPPVIERVDLIQRKLELLAKGGAV